MRTPFDDLVEAYDAARPSYPGEVVDALEPAGKTVLEMLAQREFGGVVVVEVNTRRAESRPDREADLAEALAYTRLHLAAVAV